MKLLISALMTRCPEPEEAPWWPALSDQPSCQQQSVIQYIVLLTLCMTFRSHLQLTPREKGKKEAWALHVKVRVDISSCKQDTFRTRMSRDQVGSGRSPSCYLHTALFVVFPPYATVIRWLLPSQVGKLQSVAPAQIPEEIFLWWFVKNPRMGNTGFP